MRRLSRFSRYLRRQPLSIHITVSKTARLRRQNPKGIVVHREDLGPKEITVHEGIPLTTVSKTVADILKAGEHST